ncbi:RHS repeat domain-containing protein [Sorangium sp. So ce1097]|uniref:RHS repeat domain-containing protein n=1 Tax=Sorangium sp. So ce1097 TaxID=3133330 RepID=UPI003F5E38D8
MEGGFIAGLLLGAVPFAGVGHGLLGAAGVLAHGTPEARMGLAIGQNRRAETLYFGDLVERVTDRASGTVEHRYHVRSPERVVAIVTRGGSDGGTRYVHVDHLGSIDALTDEDGDVIERWSYDPFGQRRNPVWGQTAPASFSSETTQGFTGHESDDELGLVNMKGRIYDPRIGRFLTTDPIVSMPSFGQSWNPYSYVLNNPLAYVDPGGFQQAPPEDGAVASALGALEGEPARFDEMLRAFAFMVDRQIEHQARSDGPRRRRRSQTAPPLGSLHPYRAAPERIVLVEGGANAGWPADAGAAGSRSELVHLVACRASGERFEAFLRPRQPLGPSVAHQLEVPERRLLDGEDAGAALARFRAFVGPGGVLGAWGTFTLGLLAQEGLGRPPSLDLRDLCARHLRRRPGGIANGARALLAGEPAEPPARGSGRAGRTLGWLEVVLARLLELAGEDEHRIAPVPDARIAV